MWVLQRVPQLSHLYESSSVSLEYHPVKLMKLFQIGGISILFFGDVCERLII